MSIAFHIEGDVNIIMYRPLKIIHSVPIRIGEEWDRDRWTNLRSVLYIPLQWSPHLYETLAIKEEEYLHNRQSSLVPSHLNSYTLLLRITKTSKCLPRTSYWGATDVLSDCRYMFLARIYFPMLCLTCGTMLQQM